MVTLGDAHPTPNRQFGFQVFLGLGFGLAISAVTMMGRIYAEEQWIGKQFLSNQPLVHLTSLAAVTQGALTQMRSLGGSLGLAACVIVFNKKIRASESLVNELDPSQMSALLKSPLVISSFSPEQQALVAKVYAKAFTQEMKVATYIAAACFVFACLTWQPKRLRPQLMDLEVANDSTANAEGEQSSASRDSPAGEVKE